MANQPLGAGDRVVVAGASGLVGSTLMRSLRASGVEVTQLVRHEARTPHQVQWSPGDNPLDPQVLQGARAVIGLNGASIGKLPWTTSYRETLISSRLRPTRTLAAAVRQLGATAPLLLSASASGYYGSQNGAEVDETSANGEGFLASLTAEWEAAALEAGPEARVARMRISPIIHADGVLAPMITLTKFGLGGPLGSGRQVWAWSSMADTVGAFRHVIEHDITGAVNIAGPHRATENDIGFALAMRLQRPYLVRAPRFALRTLLGDAANDLLLVDTLVRPRVLENTGFVWKHPTAAEAVKEAIPAR